MFAAVAGLALATLLGTSNVSARAGLSSSCTTSVYSAGGLPLSIPDPGTLNSSLSVPSGGEVEHLSIELSITHPFDSDLHLQLVSPSGAAVELARAVGMWGHDFTKTVFDDEASTSIVSSLPPFTGSFRPVEPLSALQGSPQGGSWILRVTDERAGYAGRLTAWSLDITSCPSVPPPSPVPAGAPTPPPLPTGVPSGALPAHGMPITVTASSDDLDGDTSSVADLLANPGADGTISLREAIEATNNDPGTYTIGFASSLAGSTIDVGAYFGHSLPELTGGNVWIDGDINGDGKPDVTLDGQDITSPQAPYGFLLQSGGNRLHALNMVHFNPAVWLSAVSPNSVDPTLPTHETFAANVISGLRISQVQGWWGNQPTGILLESNLRGYKCNSTACPTYDSWNDTRIVGNSISSRAAGIRVELEAVANEEVQRMTVASNTVQVGTAGTATDTPHTVGMELKAGLGGGANDNRLTDVLAAYNDVEVAGGGEGISGASGQMGGSSNVVQNLDLLGNDIVFSGQPSVRTGPDPRLRAIEFALSDGCSGGPGVGCSAGNVLEDVRIVGNLLEGQSNAGVLASDPCCAGHMGTTLTDFLVADNLIEGTIPPDELDPWGVLIPGNYTVSNVTVDSNTVEQQITDPTQQHAADLAGGGIVVAGAIGSGGPGGSASGVAITNNLITTPLAGITLVGGAPSDDLAAQDASGGTVSDVVLRGNDITQQPTLAQSLDPSAKGIEVIGGLGGTPPSTGHWTASTGNSVTSVTLGGNLVDGVTDDVTVHSNFGTGAYGNTAALGLHPPTLTVSRSGAGHGTVRSDPSGIACGLTCSQAFDDRSRVTLTAKPNRGSTFTGWSGACTGSLACVVTMNSNESVTATFDALCVVPQVKGETLAKARRSLTHAHCTLGRVKRVYSRTVKRGRVISQRPGPRTQLATSAAVNVRVSKGTKRHR